MFLSGPFVMHPFTKQKTSSERRHNNKMKVPSKKKIGSMRCIYNCTNVSQRTMTITVLPKKE